MILYLILIALLVSSMLIYFKIAKECDIIDHPNERSAHNEITLRGGGVIFPLVFIFFLIYKFFITTNIDFDDRLLINYSLKFGAGFFLICAVSFCDDLVDLSSEKRLVFHFISVSFLLYFINAYEMLPIWAIPSLYVLIIGILNAFNFMDGINGITGCYSIVVLGALFYINEFQINFTDQNFIIFPILASAVFLFFNFRKRAKCFMGDIGSLGIGFWILALLGLLIIKTNEIKYIFFLAVYGIEVVSTIVERLTLKENIFQAHRRHLYQLLVNEKEIDHRIVGFVYAFVQLIICVTVIEDFGTNNLLPITIFSVTIICYYLLKNNIKRTIK